MTSLLYKINEEARLWEKTKDEKHKKNWYKLLKKYSEVYATFSNNRNKENENNT
jgi:hypothetical protein